AGGFSYSGQTCISVQRVYVHAQVHSEFLAALAENVAQLKVGDPADPETQVSALITPAESDRVQAWAAEAVQQGALLVAGGGRGEDGVLLPTLLDRVEPKMSISHSEVFGPVLGVAAYNTFDQAVDMANDTRYGLQAGVFTQDISTALRAAERIDFGGVLINEVPAFRVDQQPYGGLRDSGNTREGPVYAMEEMTERKTIIIQS
ncbi:MAG: aldehyde dehydrogenase family protein, partial [Actinomycetes bacterium]